MNNKKRRRWTTTNTPSCLQTESLEDRLLLSAGHSEPEHAAMMALVPAAEVTHTVVQSGNWTDPATWADGQVPTAAATVRIPADVALMVGGDLSSTPVSAIRVDGTLRFDRTTDTHLVVETIVVTSGGWFDAGTVASPIHTTRRLTVTFADTGEMDPAEDPWRLGRGLIATGRVTIAGSKIRSHVRITERLTKGTQSFDLATRSHRWRIGDRLLIPGVNAYANQDEHRKIVGVDGRTIAIDRPLDFNHVGPLRNLRVHAANLTRNVVFESENVLDTNRRGHIMLMSPQKVHIEYAAFNGLGRTDKRTPVEDAMFRDDGSWIEGTGGNQRGRYSVHFHQGGPHGKAAMFRGNAVVDSPGWGVVNHSSNVTVVDNVVYHVGGSAFVTEAGDEIGKFRNNIAIRSIGSGQGLLTRTEQQDFGHGGNGFWFQGSGLEVSRNVASGHPNIGFMYFARAHRDADGNKLRFPTENLRDKSLADGADSVDIRQVPLFLFSNNTAFAVGQGLQTWFHHSRSADGNPTPTVVDDLTVWHASSRGVQLTYSSGIVFRNPVLIGHLNNPHGAGFRHHVATQDIRYEGSRVEGFEIGIEAPIRGHNEILGGNFRNIIDIQVNRSEDPEEYLLRVDDGVDGRPIRFHDPKPSALKDREKQTFQFTYAETVRHSQNPNLLFVPVNLLVNAPGYENRQLYFEQQAANYIPFPESALSVPEEFVGLTNQELNDGYGLSIGGYTAPPDATHDPLAGVFASEPQPTLPPVRVTSGLHTNGIDYKLRYQAGEEEIREPDAAEIREGWNLFTRSVEDHDRTMLVWGDTTAPEFELKGRTPTSLNPQDRGRTLFLYGTVHDESPSGSRYKKLRNLSSFDTGTDETGREFIRVRLDIPDRAENETTFEFPIYLDPEAPTLDQLYRSDVPGWSIPEILLEG